MAYEPTVWSTGDTITAEKLNKLENGVGAGGQGDSPMFIVDCDDFIVNQGTGTATFVDCTKQDILNSCVENPNTKIQLNVNNYGYGVFSIRLYLSNLVNENNYQYVMFTSPVFGSSAPGISKSVVELSFGSGGNSAIVGERAVIGSPLIVAFDHGGVWKVNNIDAVKAVYERCELEPVLIQPDATKNRVFHLVDVEHPSYSEWDFLYSGMETVNSVTSMVYQKCHVDSTGVCTFSQEYRVTLS